MSKSRNEIKARSPSKPVSTSEENRINTSFTNITHSTEKFMPVQGVTYLWVFKPSDIIPDTKEIIIGIEKPWKYPQAFGMKETDEHWKFIKQQLKEADELGHVTLAANFETKGEAKPEESKAYIGGELQFNNGQWRLDNASGRFGDIEKPLNEVRQLMNEVADHFENSTGIKPAVYVRPPKTSNYKSLKQAWKEGDKDENSVDKAIKLLQQYVVTQQGFIASIEKKQYKKEVIDALSEFKKRKPETIQDFLDYFSKALKNNTNINDPLIEQLMFIARKSRSEFKLSEEYVLNKLGKPSS